MFAGADSVWSPGLWLIHIGDTLVSVDPGSFKSRLESAGFALMGTSLALLTAAVTTFFVLAFVELLALRMARVSPNLAASISNAVTTGVSTWRSASKTRRTRIHLGGHGETEWAVS